MPASLTLPQPEDVAYLRGDSNYTYVHLINGQKQFHSITLRAVISGYYPSFFRCHKTYAVNRALIDQTATSESAGVVIQIGKASLSLPVARRRRKDLEAVLSQALAEVEQ